MTNNKYAFYIDFVCSNCGHNFREKFRKGQRVIRYTIGEYRVYEGWICVGSVKCPNCDSTKDLQEKKRQPVRRPWAGIPFMITSLHKPRLCRRC